MAITGNCVAEIREGRYQKNVKIRTLMGGFVTISDKGGGRYLSAPPPGGVGLFFWNSPNNEQNVTHSLSSDSVNGDL